MWPDTQTLSSSYSNWQSYMIYSTSTPGTATSFSSFTTYNGYSSLPVTLASSGIFNPYRCLAYTSTLNFDNINYISYSFAKNDGRWLIHIAKITTYDIRTVKYGTANNYDGETSNSIHNYNDYGYSIIDLSSWQLGEDYGSFLFDVSAASGTKYLCIYVRYDTASGNSNTSDNTYFGYFANIKAYYNKPTDSFDFTDSTWTAAS